jgi:hypothetical protein
MEQEAKEDFTRRVRELVDEEKGPGLCRVLRVAWGEIVEEEFIVSRPPTYIN